MLINWCEPAHGSGMILYASGPLLHGQTIMGSPAEIVGALVETHLAGCDSDRPMARRAIASAVADEIQAALLKAAIADGHWSYDGATSAEIDRLTRSRTSHDPGGEWKARALSLILVRPEGSWERPRGKILVIDPTTDFRLLQSLVHATWLRVEQIA